MLRGLRQAREYPIPLWWEMFSRTPSVTGLREGTGAGQARRRQAWPAVARHAHSCLSRVGLAAWQPRMSSRREDKTLGDLDKRVSTTYSSLGVTLADGRSLVLGLVFDTQQSSQRFRCLGTAGPDVSHKISGSPVVIANSVLAEPCTAHSVGSGNPRQYRIRCRHSSTFGIDIINIQIGDLKELTRSRKALARLPGSARPSLHRGRLAGRSPHRVIASRAISPASGSFEARYSPSSKVTIDAGLPVHDRTRSPSRSICDVQSSLCGSQSSGTTSTMSISLEASPSPRTSEPNSAAHSGRTAHDSISEVERCRSVSFNPPSNSAIPAAT